MISATDYIRLAAEGYCSAVLVKECHQALETVKITNWLLKKLGLVEALQNLIQLFIL